MKGVGALVSGYALLAILAVPSMLPAADGDPPAPAPAPTEVAPAPVEPEADQSTVPDTEQPPTPAAAAPSGEVVEVPAARKQATHEVAMRNIKFVPKTINVDVGDTITWHNEDAEPHNAIAEDDSFRTETFGQGESASATIDEPGSHPYFCSIHAGMKGTVVAGGGGGGGGGGTGGGGGGGSTGGSGSSGASTGSSAGATGSSSTPGIGTGSTSSSSGSSGSLPSTGSEELWFALAGAWLLTVGVAVRTALGGRPA